MSGPPPKPTALKKLAGNPGRKRLNELEPDPKKARMYAPKHLPEEGKEEWRRLSEELYKLGLLTIVDRAALTAYCQCWADYLEAEIEVQIKGKILKTEKEYEYINPWWSVRNKSLELMHKFEIEFGFTPGSRSRVRSHGKEQEASLAELLFSGVNDDADE